ncbi:MAG: methyl-accepting chemotaxis protein [Sporomusaceae bacterium]|nr:methyl-accepting chemotaxis protein [Sporomusaceae bacterium]
MADISEFDALVKSAEMIQKIIPLECCVMVCNSEGIIVKFVPAETFDMQVKEGAVITKEGAIGECMSTGRPSTKLVPKDIYGVPIKATAFPILEAGKLVGSFALGISLKTQQGLMEAAQTIAATSEQMTSTTEELATTATHLSQGLATIGEIGEKVATEVKNTDEILRFVSDVAANSNLLGLNAAIEAARAGEHGRGFAVVADEIRKMAVNSADAVKDIKVILNKIKVEGENLKHTVDKNVTVAERQAAATEEIAASMQSLTSSATQVEQVARQL